MSKETINCRVVHLTSVHYAFDTRIFHKECKSLAEAGYDVTLIAPHGDGDLIRGGIKLRAIEPPRNRRERMLSTVRAVYRAAVGEDADIYHFHDPELIPVGALLKLRGKKVIYDVHENYAGTMHDKQWLPPGLRGLASIAVSACETTLTRSCDWVIAATPTIANKFRPQQTQLVQNYPWLNELFVPDALPYERREELAVYVGWLGDDRGMREMTQAVELAAKTISIKLVIGGKLIPGARGDFQDSRRSNLVEYLGFLTRPQVADLVSRAKIGMVTVLPGGNNTNAQPTKLFEYMSAGLPVIASDFPVFRQIVESAGCGILVDPQNPVAIANAMVWLLQNSSQAAEMGRSGRRAVAKRYNWEREAKFLVAAYDELVPAHCFRSNALNKE